jgi:hypothetical protein
MDWAAYVHLAFDEIRLASAGSPQVARRMAAALDDLLVVAPADRRPPLEQQRELLREVIGDAGLARADADFARMPDGQGIGVAASASAAPASAGDIVSAKSRTAAVQLIQETNRYQPTPGPNSGDVNPRPSSEGSSASTTPP